MSHQIRLRDIGLFHFMPEECLAIIRSIFELRKEAAYVPLFSYGNVVPGVLIVLDGSIEVILEGTQLPIAIMTRGDSVGEMSLVEENATASANVRTGAYGATFIFAKRDEILKTLHQESEFAKCFYRGVAHMMNQRLRQTNQKIREQLDHGTQKLEGFMKQIEMLAKLDQTKSTLDETGYSIISHMSKISKDLAQLKSVSTETGKILIGDIETQVEQVMLGESQNFDRICQMLDQLHQHFENLRRVVNGGNTKAISGDTALFETPA